MYSVGKERAAAIGLPDKNDHCSVCGRENARGLNVPFGPDGEGGSRAVYAVQGEPIGWPGLLHGGLAFALMDEALGWCLYYNGLRGYTARAEARLDSGGLLAEVDATMYLV